MMTDTQYHSTGDVLESVREALENTFPDCGYEDTQSLWLEIVEEMRILVPGFKDHADWLLKAGEGHNHETPNRHV